MRAASIAVGIAALAATAVAAPLPVTLDGGATAGSVTAHGTKREAITITAPASLRARVDALPADARLLTAIAVPLPSAAAPSSPIRFRVVFESDGKSTALYERVLDGSDARDRRWVDVGVALAPVAGQSGTLQLETTPLRSDAAGAGASAWWAPPELASCAGESPSLLLITIDALRADHVGSAGYGRATTPYLDAFAADATRFTSTFVAGPKTIPSIPQLLTGSYFYWHRRGSGLTDLLGSGDLPSHAIVNNPYVAIFLGRAQPGFDAVHAGDLDARAITSAGLRYLTSAGRCPTALYLHYLDTHTPYHAPARYARRFIDRDAPTSIGLTFGDITRAWKDGYGAADKQRIVDLYDGSLVYTDRQIGRLLRGLARRGRLDHTLVIVTADHGEEFWDHRHFFHGQSLYDELLHVPLLVRFPSVGHGRVVEQLVRTVDILPTIAETLGHAAGSGDGLSLRPLAAGDAAAAAHERTAFALVSHAEPRTPERQAVRTKTAKLIRNMDDGQLEIYDLGADPREKRNLGPAAPAAPALQKALDAFRAQLDGKGYQLRLHGRPDRPVRYTIDVISVPAQPLIGIDRLSLDPGDIIDFKPHTSAFTVTGTLTPGDEDRLRFDTTASGGGLKVVVRLDDAPAPAGTLRLGARGVAAKGPLIDLNNPDVADTPPTPAASDAVTVELWRASPPATDTAAPPLDDATRERLRQLGYVE